MANQIHNSGIVYTAAKTHGVVVGGVKEEQTWVLICKTAATEVGLRMSWNHHHLILSSPFG